MKVSVLLGHPYEGSFNFAIAQTVVETLRESGHEAVFHDLYREGFDPVIPKEELVSDLTQDPLVARHQKEIREADGIVIVHPNWWGQPPAILKGWVDRVLREQVAYTFSEGDTGGGLPIGLLRAKTGLVFNTSNTPEQRETEVFGDPLDRLWKDCIFNFCGVSMVDRVMFRVVADSSDADRKEWLRQTKERVNRCFPQQG